MSEITVEKTAEDSASKSLRVTVPVDRVREAEAKALKYYVRQARLPGFRPGKAPEAVVRKRFGDDAIVQMTAVEPTQFLAHRTQALLYVLQRRERAPNARERFARLRERE